MGFDARHELVRKVNGIVLAASDRNRDVIEDETGTQYPFFTVRGEETVAKLHPIFDGIFSLEVTPIDSECLRVPLTRDAGVMLRTARFGAIVSQREQMLVTADEEDDPVSLPLATIDFLNGCFKGAKLIVPPAGEEKLYPLITSRFAQADEEGEEDLTE